MDKATKPLMDLQRQVRGLVETMSALNRGRYSVKIDTRPATQKIGKLIRGLQMAKSEVQQLNAMGVTLGGTASRRNTSARATTTTAATAAATFGSAARSRSTYVPRQSTPAKQQYSRPLRTGPSNLGYKIFGATNLPNNGGMGIDMLKGMGIAYGIAGIGNLVSDIVKESAEYDNLMKTVENILKSHDTGVDFSNRFSSMTSTVRNVGMETKFKVTEVADAAKFLAMAGLDVSAISQAIRPIADIALVGDTELGQTADLVTNIMTAYNIAPSRMRNAADVMTNTFTMSNTTLTEIAEAYKYAASLLSAGKVDFKEATAAIGVLGDAGIKGSQAGTTLRTIMANIVNPTKKQQAAWDEIGINRFNKDGSRKGLLEIFQELSNANLGVESYYRLFHKTAASGAVALASHADKWQDVYIENQFAGGLSAMLADEKKNTLQGLWAQLVSVFTDKGVTAFSGVQGQLRGIMSSAINWLKTDEATQAFKSVSQALMEFVHIIIDASKWFARLYKDFGPMIKAWMKFQLVIWPVVKAITALKSVMLALMGLRKLGFMVMGWGNSFLNLGKQAAFAGKSVANANTATSMTMTAGTGLLASPAPGVIRHVGPLGSTLALSNKQMNWVQKGFVLGKPDKRFFGLPLGIKVKPLSQPTPPIYDRGSSDIVKRHQKNRERLLSYQGERRDYEKRINRRATAHQALNGISGLAGIAGVGYGMHKLTDDNNTWQDNWAGGLYMGAGTAAMMGGAWGMGIGAILAIFGGIFQMLGAAAQSTKTLNDIQDFVKKHAVKNGVIAGSEDQVMQYLEAQKTAYIDINDLLQKRTELTAKYLGLESSGDPMGASTGVYATIMDKYEKLKSNDIVEAYNAMSLEQFQTGQRLVEDSQHKGVYYLTTANGIMHTGLNGSEVVGVDGSEAVMVRNKNINPQKAAFASMAAMSEIMSPGGYYEKTVKGFSNNVAKLVAKGADQFTVLEYINTVLDTNNPKNLTNLIGLSDITDTDNWSIERMLQDEETRKVMYRGLQEYAEPIRNALLNFYAEIGKGELSNAVLSDYLQNVIGGAAGLAVKTFNPNDPTSFLAQYGFRNGVFGYRTYVDKNGQVKTYTPEENAKLMVADVEAVIDQLKSQNIDKIDGAGHEWFAAFNLLLAIGQAFTSSSEELIDVAQNQEITLNGHLFRWQEALNAYAAVGEDGQLLTVQSGLNKMNDAIGTLCKSLTYDWNTASSDLSSSLTSAYKYLNILGAFTFGTPIPNLGLNGLTNFENPGALWPGTNENSVDGKTMSFDNRGADGITTAFFGKRKNYIENWLDSRRTDSSPLTLSLEGASALVASGAGFANGFNLKNKWNNHHPDDENGDNIDPNKNTGRGTNTSDYKSHAQARVAPKQLNINIQNLMNVESIDLTNPDNVAVIEDIKQKVAYALYEAAADGVTMLNNLTN